MSEADKRVALLGALVSKLATAQTIMRSLSHIPKERRELLWMDETFNDLEKIIATAERKARL